MLATTTAKLPSTNPRPTTCKCVYLVMHGHLWLRDKDGGHTIQSATAENPMWHTNFMAQCVIKPELLLIEVLHCRNRDFLPFVPVTLTLARWPSYTNLTRIPWRYYTGCANMNFLRQGFRKLSSDRQTDMTEIIYHAALWVINDNYNHMVAQ